MVADLNQQLRYTTAERSADILMHLYARGPLNKPLNLQQGEERGCHDCLCTMSQEMCLVTLDHCTACSQQCLRNNGFPANWSDRQAGSVALHLPLRREARSIHDIAMHLN